MFGSTQQPLASSETLQRLEDLAATLRASVPRVRIVSDEEDVKIVRECAQPFEEIPLAQITSDAAAISKPLMITPQNNVCALPAPGRGEATLHDQFLRLCEKILGFESALFARDPGLLQLLRRDYEHMQRAKLRVMDRRALEMYNLYMHEAARDISFGDVCVRQITKGTIQLALTDKARTDNYKTTDVIICPDQYTGGQAQTVRTLLGEVFGESRHIVVPVDGANTQLDILRDKTFRRAPSEDTPSAIDRVNTALQLNSPELAKKFARTFQAAAYNAIKTRRSDGKGPLFDWSPTLLFRINLESNLQQNLHGLTTGPRLSILRPHVTLPKDLQIPAIVENIDKKEMSFALASLPSNPNTAVFPPSYMQNFVIQNENSIYQFAYLRNASEGNTTTCFSFQNLNTRSLSLFIDVCSSYEFFTGDDSDFQRHCCCRQALHKLQAHEHAFPSTSKRTNTGKAPSTDAKVCKGNRQPRESPAPAAKTPTSLRRPISIYFDYARAHRAQKRGHEWPKSHTCMLGRLLLTASVFRVTIASSVWSIMADGTARGVASEATTGPFWKDDTPTEGVATTITSSRDVARSFENVEQGEGMGARVRRSIGHPSLRFLGA